VAKIEEGMQPANPRRGNDGNSKIAEKVEN
jgi:hypothetical protein